MLHVPLSAQSALLVWTEVAQLALPMPLSQVECVIVALASIRAARAVLCVILSVPLAQVLAIVFALLVLQESTQWKGQTLVWQLALTRAQITSWTGAFVSSATQCA